MTQNPSRQNILVGAAPSPRYAPEFAPGAALLLLAFMAFGYSRYFDFETE
jgi:hypothetical protein